MTLADSFGPFIFKPIPPTRARAPVLDTNFEQPTYTEEDQGISITILTNPVSVSEITSWEMLFTGATEAITTWSEDVPYPNLVAFTPLTHGSIWQWGIPEFDITGKLRAISANGNGILSLPFTITIDQDSTYFIPDDMWTFLEERDYTLTSGQSGRSRITLDSSVVAPDDHTLYYFSGTLAYTESNYPTIHNTENSFPLLPSDDILNDTANTIGSDVFGVLLWEDVNGDWHQASTMKTFEVLGVILPDAPVNTVAPTITGNSKIGTSQTGNDGDWTGTDITYEYQWMSGDNEIVDADAINYTPVAGDNQASLRLRVIATNASGNTTAYSNTITVTYPTPTVATPITDVSVSQNSGSIYTVALTGVFTGSDLTYSVSGFSGVSVNQSNMSLSIDLSNVLAITPIVVTASNSGGSVNDTFNLTITATGTAETPIHISTGGSATVNNPVFVDYLTDDMIIASGFHVSVATAITPPNLAGHAGQYDWNTATAAQGNGVAGIVAWRRCASDGADGDLGTWATTGIRYTTYRGVDWADPIGDVSSAVAAGATSITHPALTLETNNSNVSVFAACASSITSQRPGQRGGTTFIQSYGSVPFRHSLQKAAVVPAPSWPAEASVPHTVVTGAAGSSFVSAVEIRGSTDAATFVWPAAVTPESWIAMTEVTDPAVAIAQGFTGESGHIRVVTNASLDVSPSTGSGDFVLVREAFGEEVGAPSPTGTLLTAGTTTYTTGNGGFPVGTTLYPRAWWMYGSGATAEFKLAWSGTPFVTVGLDADEPEPEPGDLPLLPTAALNAATGRPTSTWESSVTGQGGGLGYHGPSFVAEAYASWKGQTTADSHTINQLNTSLEGGNCPSAQSGFSMQWDIIWQTAALFIRNTPRLYNPLSSTNKNKMDYLFRAISAAAAYTCSDSPSKINGRSLTGNPTNSEGSPNFSTAATVGAMMLPLWLGSDSAAVSYLNSISPQTVYNNLNSVGLTNALRAWQPSRVTGANGPAPSYSNIQTVLNNWSRHSFSMTQRQGLWIDTVQETFNNMIQSGIDGGLGVPANRSRGKILSGASGLPFRGPVVGGREVPDTIGMVHGFNGFDASGVRSSAQYALWDWQPIILWTLADAAFGRLNKDNASVITAMNRADRGSQHIQYCCDQGYADWSHNGTGGNNSNYTSGGFEARDGWVYRFSMWFDVIMPWFEA